MISVEMGGEGDLKKQMNENIKKWGGNFGLGAEYHDYNVVKMAEHYMKKENYSSAIKLLEDLLKTPQPSMVYNTVFFILSLYSLIQ
jgi:hypothetical protein